MVGGRSRAFRGETKPGNCSTTHSLIFFPAQHTKLSLTSRQQQHVESVSSVVRLSNKAVYSYDTFMDTLHSALTLRSARLTAIVYGVGPSAVPLVWGPRGGWAASVLGTLQPPLAGAHTLASPAPI